MLALSSAPTAFRTGPSWDQVGRIGDGLYTDRRKQLLANAQPSL